MELDEIATEQEMTFPIHLKSRLASVPRLYRVRMAWDVESLVIRLVHNSVQLPQPTRSSGAVRG